MPFDEKIKNRFGFGCMRLKMNGDVVDYEEFNKMIDAFIGAGFNYFDTAHGYIDGKSETAIRDCLAARYKREDFILANKLSEWFVKEESEVLPLFESQLKLSVVEYFDYYLVHAVSRHNYEKYKSINAFGILEKLKKEGKIRHAAMSFHDTAEVLDMILSEQKGIEVVQLQINYLDFDDPNIESKKCYDVAVKHGKKVIVMEPVKGGTLALLPERAAKVLDALGSGKSYASYAIRYAASFPEVIMVLSGMGSEAMMLFVCAGVSSIWMRGILIPTKSMNSSEMHDAARSSALEAVHPCFITIPSTKAGSSTSMCTLPSSPKKWSVRTYTT